MKYRKFSVAALIGMSVLLVSGCSLFRSLAHSGSDMGPAALQASSNATLRYYCVWGKWPTTLPSEDGLDLKPVKCHDQDCVVKVSAGESSDVWYFTFQKTPEFSSLEEQTIPFKGFGYTISEGARMNSSMRGTLAVTCRPEFALHQIQAEDTGIQEQPAEEGH